MKIWSLAALETVILTTSGVASDELFVKMTTFPFQLLLYFLQVFASELWRNKTVQFELDWTGRTFKKCRHIRQRYSWSYNIGSDSIRFYRKRPALGCIGHIQMKIYLPTVWIGCWTRAAICNFAKGSTRNSYKWHFKSGTTCSFPMMTSSYCQFSSKRLPKSCCLSPYHWW